MAGTKTLEARVLKLERQLQLARLKLRDARLRNGMTRRPLAPSKAAFEAAIARLDSRGARE